MITEINTKIEPKDIEAVQHKLDLINVHFMKGGGIKCEACGKYGNFGSIMRFIAPSGNAYIICGWCATVVRV